MQQNDKAEAENSQDRDSYVCRKGCEDAQGNFKSEVLVEGTRANRVISGRKTHWECTHHI